MPSEPGNGTVELELASSADPPPAQNFDLTEADYNNWVRRHRRFLYQSQLFKDNILFALIVLIIGYALYAAHIQLKRGEEANSELPLRKSEVKLSAPFLGLMILTISLDFLYLYLVHVFPIDRADDEASEPEQQSELNVVG